MIKENGGSNFDYYRRRFAICTLLYILYIRITQ